VKPERNVQQEIPEKNTKQTHHFVVTSSTGVRPAQK
jgi:hypothetical protein